MLARLGAWTAWWLALFWLWLLLVGDWNRIEVIGAACGAAVVATLAELVRAAARESLQVGVGPLRALPVALVVVPADFAILVWALVRSLVERRVVRGAFVTRPIDAGPKTTATGRAHRAWTVLVSGFSPNAYVVEIDPDADTVLLHDLVVWRRSERPA